MRPSHFAMIIMVAIATSCASKKAIEPIVGADRDSHGCIGSAGYQWSEVKQNCIRIFEDGIQLSNIADKYSSFAAYIVFSNDSTKVEAFIPKVENAPILRIQGSAGYWSENPKFMGAYNLTHKDGIWTLLEGNTPIYSSKK